jgi:hypothetical protein
LVGRDIYELFIKDYTQKQWQKHPRELPADIIKRIPLRFTYNDNYFNDRYQGIPVNGYTAMFEKMLDSNKGDLLKSAIDFSKAWRKDKYLRRLEAMMLVLNEKHLFILSGNGDVVEPEDMSIAAIGSGGNYALSAARALDKFANMDPKDLVKESLNIAGELCIYTNTNIKILTLEDNN